MARHFLIQNGMNPTAAEAIAHGRTVALDSGGLIQSSTGVVGVSVGDYKEGEAVNVAVEGIAAVRIVTASVTASAGQYLVLRAGAQESVDDPTAGDFIVGRILAEGSTGNCVAVHLLLQYIPAAEDNG